VRRARSAHALRRPRPRRHRGPARPAFLGYAGWGAARLDEEVERDDWIISDFAPEDAFTEDPDAL
jgi:putative AlgH/UPF0301 family transcriptional regulator